MAAMLLNTIAVFSEVFGLCRKIHAKLHRAKQPRKAAQTLLAKDLESFHRINMIREQYSKNTKKWKNGKIFINYSL